MRQCIERAFGLLTKRWGIFWRPLQCDFDRWPTIINVCAKLHNFCIDHNDSDIAERYELDIQPGDNGVVLHNPPVPEENNNRPSGTLRKSLTDKLEVEGIRRFPTNEF